MDVNTELSIYGSLLARTLTKEEMAAAKNGGHRLVNGDQLIIFNNVDGYGARTKVSWSLDFPDITYLAYSIMK